MHKILKSTKLFIAVLCIFMLCSGIVLNSLMNIEIPENVNAGGYSIMPAYQPGNSYQLASTVDIAVVNLDEGVKLREKTAYYAGKLITFPNEHFHMTGLDDAKKGLEAGIYGAYIVIPATFSKSVESINDKPEKATIQYTVNGDNNSASLASQSVSAKIFIEFVALIVRNRIYNLLKEQMLRMESRNKFMTVPAAIRELEKIEMVRRNDKNYKLDHAVTKTQKTILSSFGLDEYSINKKAEEISKLLITGQSLMSKEEHDNGTEEFNGDN